MSLTVTATGSSPNQGIFLNVQVLTAATLAGSPAVLEAGGTYNGNITTTEVGSYVLGVMNDWDAAESQTPVAGCSQLSAYEDSTNSSTYATFSTTSATVTPGTVSVGFTYDGSDHDGYGVAACEIIPSGGSIGFDASTPADVADETGTAVTTASFSPPAGSLLVALVVLSNRDGVDNNTYTVSMSDTGGLTWTLRAFYNGSVTGNTAYVGVFTAVVPSTIMDVTATFTGADLTGVILTVKALTGATNAAGQTGATSTADAACFASITTTETGSVVYGTWSDGNEDVPSPYDANTTLLTTADNAPVGDTYGTFRSTSPTGTPGAITLGVLPTNITFPQAFAQAEILPNGTIAEDASSPAGVYDNTANAVTTASFAPPPGSLLVAIVNGGGTASGQTVAVTDSSGLTWTQLVTEQGFPYFTAGVWVADVPGGGSTPSGTVQPKATGSIPRRRSARAVIARILGPANAHGPSAVSSGWSVTRRRPAGAFFGGIASTVVAATLAAAPVTGGHVYQRAQPPHRAVTAHVSGPANAHGPSGTVQRLATVPVPRRTAARGAWAHVTGPANAHGGNGTVQPRAAVPVPRRTTARVVWSSAAGPANARGPAGTVQPRASVPLPRRTAARAAWARILGTVNAHGPSGTVQPRTALEVGRRTSVRAVWAHIAGTVSTTPHPSGTVQPKPTAPEHRRTAARAGQWARITAPFPPPAGTVQPRAVIPVPRRTAVRALIAHVTAPFPPPSGTVQPRAAVAVPRRATARVTWRGNAVPGSPPQPATGGLIRRRAAARVLWHGIAGPQPAPVITGTPATGGRVTRRPGLPARILWHGAAGPANAHGGTGSIQPHIPVPRRTAARAAWHGYAATGIIPPVITARFTAGQARSAWTAGQARSAWEAGAVAAYSQSVLSLQYVQVPVTAFGTAGTYNPTGDSVQFSFTPANYPVTEPSVWVAGSWATFPGPAYWAQCLVGPGGATALTIGTYQLWLKITDSPEVPVLQPTLLTITP